MESKFNLPASSFDELVKIIRAYSHLGGEAALADVAQLTAINRTRVSGNNKFLVDVGLITAGMKKAATDLGQRLGRALEHDQVQDAKACWREAVQSNEALAGLVTTVRIKGGMSDEEFASHVLYVSGQKNNSGNRTGARAVAAVLKEAGLIAINEGQVRVAAAEPESVETELQSPVPPATETPEREIRLPEPPIGNTLRPSIAINVELHLPATEDEEVYSKLFRALRTELLERQ